jgi:hypothetical protein
MKTILHRNIKHRPDDRRTKHQSLGSCHRGYALPDRWVYCAFILNWSTPAETDPATVAVFAKALSQATTIVKDCLSPG